MIPPPVSVCRRQTSQLLVSGLDAQILQLTGGGIAVANSVSHQQKQVVG